MKPIICITFDDSNISDYDAFEEMRKRGFKGTSYVIANDEAFKNNVLVNNLDNLKRMRSYGWDIQDHITGNYDLSQMSLAEQQQEFLDSLTFFQTIGFHVEHVAYPMGEYNADTLTAIQTVRKTGRTTNVGLNDYSTIAWFELKNIAGDMVTQNQYNTVINYINQTIEENKIMIINFHQMSLSNLVRFGYFTSMLEYIKNKKIAVMTISEMYNYVMSL